MIVMPSNNVGFACGLLFGKYPDMLAHLHSANQTHSPHPKIPWALDNGVFGAFSSGRPWNEEPFYTFLEAFAHLKPRWVVVPDCVGDRDTTLRMWDRHFAAVSAYKVPLAFAVQDGMTPDDVPSEAEVVFVGGSTSWKWGTLTMWTKNFKRVHVGRVNTARLLTNCRLAGAESCDGTGWFRHPSRTQELEQWLADPVNDPFL